MFKGLDIRLSTEAYNQGVVWYKITAGLLVTMESAAARVTVHPSLLLIRDARTEDQGQHAACRVN